MKQFLRHTAIIARRDFGAVVMTPTFILFLLAPLLMIGLAIAGGSGAESAARNTADAERIAIIAQQSDFAPLLAAETRLRSLGISPPKLEIILSTGRDIEKSNALFADKAKDYSAVMHGNLAAPTVRHEETARRSAAFLSEIAEQVVRARKSGVTEGAKVSAPQMEPIKAARVGVSGQRTTAYFAVVGIFFLTLLLAGQAVGMLAEEKSNKVIEILAAAAPLEAVFLGKLVGMFGVALLFVSFWAGLAAVGLAVTPQGAALAMSLDPAVGMIPFLILCALYFTMSYMLLGAVFLALGGLAATMREIQLMSLPITILQFAMYGMASAASGKPGTTLSMIAEIVPFSSPMAMASRAATEPALWPHVIGFAWQAFWVVIFIIAGARLFRFGVLKSGGWRALFSGSKPAPLA
jgi:ABC-2 type transport system permease protein